MFLNAKRILMVAVGASPGGGGAAAQPTTDLAAPAPAAGTPAAAPAAAITPPPTPAQGPAPVDVAQLARAVSDSVFAELRRAGVVKKAAAPAATDTPAATPAAQPTQDVGKLRALDRALMSTGLASRLVDDDAYRRIERDFMAESPDDARDWATRYFAGFGVVTPAAPAATPAAAAAAASPNAAQPASSPAPTPQPTNVRPASDAGGPPPPRQHLEDVDLVSASVADREALLKSKGLKWYTDTLHNQMRDRKIKLR